ncbi:MAG: exopolysaccharide biosynthesis polyprenyl glycosylphosphotransferase [Candidatus Jorgensenbacteria bacterium]
MSLLKKVALFLGDILLLYAALAATLLIRYGWAEFPMRLADHIIPFSITFIAWLLVLYLSDLYHLKSFSNPATLARNLSLATAIAAGISVAFFYLFSGFFELTPKTNLLIFAAAFFVFDYGWRLALLRAFVSGAAGVILIGDSPRITEIAEHLRIFPHTGYRIAATFPDVSTLTFEALSSTIETTHATLLVAPPESREPKGTLHLVYRALPLGISVVNFADFYGTIFEKVPLEDLGEQWFIENISTRRPFYDRAKRLIDMGLGGVLAVALSPFMLLAALLTLLTSPGPVIFSQERMGKSGRPFMLHKFRTMRARRGEASWPEATGENDARVTPLGKFLRYTHIDEFPQLWNIVRGNLSFTGPRPESSELVKRYQRLPFYEMRHVVKPGVTGWAQINYRPSASLEEAYEKLKYDLYYVKNRSLFLDLLIILKTIRHLFVSFTA